MSTSHRYVKAAIGLGGNLGDRESFIHRAAKRLGEDALLEARLSSLYESPPWGITEQPHFLNAVVVGLTEWEPPAIVNFCKTLETELGRTPGVRFGPREIDLDLIAYGDRVWKSEGVEVPHPRMTDRAFVLLPLAEVWPGWCHPAFGSTVEQFAAALPAPQVKATSVFQSPRTAPVR